MYRIPTAESFANVLLIRATKRLLSFPACLLKHATCLRHPNTQKQYFNFLRYVRQKLSNAICGHDTCSNRADASKNYCSKLGSCQMGCDGLNWPSCCCSFGQHHRSKETAYQQNNLYYIQTPDKLWYNNTWTQNKSIKFAKPMRNRKITSYCFESLHNN